MSHLLTINTHKRTEWWHGDTGLFRTLKPDKIITYEHERYALNKTRYLRVGMLFLRGSPHESFRTDGYFDIHNEGEPGLICPLTADGVEP